MHRVVRDQSTAREEYNVITSTSLRHVGTVICTIDLYPTYRSGNTLTDTFCIHQSLQARPPHILGFGGRPMVG